MFEKIKRALVFVHYDKDAVVDDYVLFYLKSLRAHFEFVVFVSTSPLSLAEIERVRKYANEVMVRDNVGYDFYSYKIGLEIIRKRRESYSEVAICNDSVYGPLYSLEQMFDSMRSVKADFWGVTDSNEISHHIQSYFLLFRESVLLSESFYEFWNGVEILDTKWEIIKRYEVGLTRFLESRGFQSASFVDFTQYALKAYIRLLLFQFGNAMRLPISKLISRLGDIPQRLALPSPNPAHLLWREMLEEKKMPFLKIELLRDNPMRMPVSDYADIIRRRTTYDVMLIENHLRRVRGIIRASN